MRAERMDRFSILPFSIGCASQSSVDVIPQTQRKFETESKPSHEELDDQKMVWKSSNISDKLQQMVKSFKSLPRVFQLHRVLEHEEEEEELEVMEIGVPTDVQHVAHIGWDGSNSSSVTNINSMKSSWDRTLHSCSPLPLSFNQQFELATSL